MNETKYDVIFLNGEKTTIYAMGFHDAILESTVYAKRQAWGDRRIKYISDEYTTISEIIIELGHRKEEINYP